MADPSQEAVVEVLEGARGLVQDYWGSSNPDVEFDEANGWACASVAMSTSAGGCSMSVRSIAAHIAFLQAAGQPVPERASEIVEAVYAFNDAQLTREPVLSALDAALLVILAAPYVEAQAVA